MKTKLLILIMSALALGACAKKKSSGARSIRGTNYGMNQQYGPGVSSCSTNMWGMIYDYNSTGYQFTSRLIDFTGNQDIGYVESNPSNAQTGVDMHMSARFVNGQFDAANSKLVIRIIDDKAATQGQLQDIPLVGQTGQISGQGQFTAVFQDQYGTVMLQGRKDYSQNMIGGTISYQNINGGQQTLGSFWIHACTVTGI